MQKTLSCYGLTPQQAMNKIDSNIDEFYKLIYKHCGGCNDAMQDVYLYIKSKNIHRYPPDLNLSTFICNSAKTRSKNFKKSLAQRQVAPIGEFDIKSNYKNVNYLENKEMLDAVFSQCSESEIDLLTEHYIEGKTLEEIGQKFSLTKEAVRQRLISVRYKLGGLREKFFA
jgi:RNA polymerase sigma factor (sigma-70 family)